MNNNSLDLKKELKHHIGIEDFRGDQKQIIERIMNGESLLTIMPTGGGKSLCFALPSILKVGYVLVVSPLISLMENQVIDLQKKGVRAAALHSNLSQKETNDVYMRLKKGELHVLYVSPERLINQEFRSHVQNNKPSLLIVDEAHCILIWGKDFRRNYLKIPKFAREFQIRQTVAFTATATKEIQTEIVDMLSVYDRMKIHKTSLGRKNLNFITLIGNKDYLLDQILKSKTVPTIIYCASIVQVCKLVARYNILNYHGKMSKQSKDMMLKCFLEDHCPVIVCTNSFGMGIDRPDIARIIHYNMPGSLESYQQEAGRAGRNGAEAEAILLFQSKDERIHEKFIKNTYIDRIGIYRVYQYLRNYPGNEIDINCKVIRSTFRDFKFK